MNLERISFYEFLVKKGEANLLKMLKEHRNSMLVRFERKLKSSLEHYLIVGGVKEAIDIFIATNDISKVRKTQERLLRELEFIIAKDAPDRVTARKARMIFDSVPKQLLKTNKKFMYTNVKDGARGRDYGASLEFLIENKLLIKQENLNKNSSAFKMYYYDVGLLGCALGLPPGEVTHEALLKQFAIQELFLTQGKIPAYWSNDKGAAEVDAIIERPDGNIPVEVSVKRNLKSKARGVYKEIFGVPYTIRLSGDMNEMLIEEDLIDLPLYMTDEVLNIERIKSV